MPYIKNISRFDIERGTHHDTGDGKNCILIQISDHDMRHPTPVQKFKEIYRFNFLDVDEPGPYSPNQDDADCIVKILQHAVDDNLNVIVHCTAGICRSDAVAEMGVMMGLEDTGAHRQPNVLLKKLMMKNKGWTYD